MVGRRSSPLPWAPPMDAPTLVLVAAVSALVGGGGVSWWLSRRCRRMEERWTAASDARFASLPDHSEELERQEGRIATLHHRIEALEDLEAASRLAAVEHRLEELAARLAEVAVGVGAPSAGPRPERLRAAAEDLLRREGLVEVRILTAPEELAAADRLHARGFRDGALVFAELRVGDDDRLELVALRPSYAAFP